MAAKKKPVRGSAKKSPAKKATNARGKPAKKAAAKKAPAKKAPAKKAAAKKTAAKKAPAKKAKGGGKTRQQALAEARKKISRKGKTPRFSKVGSRAAEISQAVIQAYAAASREMAEWLAAARRSDKTA